MAGLGLRLAAGDKLLVNGAAIQVETETRITLLNHANILFGRQIMAPDEATTPARRIYYTLQTVHVGTEEERAEALKSAAYFIGAFAAETTSAHARHLLAEALDAAREGRGYDALRFARRIIRHEDAVLDARDRAVLAALLSDDPFRLEALKIVRSLALPDCWIGAGFVRDAVWDHLHGYNRAPFSGDIDVVWFDTGQVSAEIDRDIERRLQSCSPAMNWSVKNQARMHRRNGDAPYRSVGDAISHWPETATAIAVRLDMNDQIEISAPLGLADLFSLRLKPTQAFATDKLHIFKQRISAKRWIERYPSLRIIVA